MTIASTLTGYAFDGYFDGVAGSGENGQYYAWLQYFYDGYEYGYLDKTTTNRIRAIRAF